MIAIAKVAINGKIIIEGRTKGNREKRIIDGDGRLVRGDAAGDARRLGRPRAAARDTKTIRRNAVLVVRRRPRRRGAASMLLILASLSLLLLLLESSSLPSPSSLAAADASKTTMAKDATTAIPSESSSSSPSSSSYVPMDPNDGPANLAEGLRLLSLARPEDAAAPLWRAVVLHTHGSNSDLYDADDAFGPFLRCHVLLDRVVDGLVYIAIEGYLRGQDGMGELYLDQALGRDGGHEAALELQRVIMEYEGDHVVPGAKEHSRRYQSLMEIRRGVDVSNPDNRRKEKEENRDPSSSSSTRGSASAALGNETPEELYNLGTVHFNAKNLPYASELFELSCRASDNKLSVACTNAVYLRTNLCDWGYRGEEFEGDMRIIREVTEAEARMYRSVVEYGTSGREEEGIVRWKRSTSVHPHMMLGYPLGNEHAMLKRYSAESLANLDELRARAHEGEDIRYIKELPNDLPYSVDDMRKTFIERHREQQQIGRSPTPIRVGFVACSFNSKAVLYLSHDMFRFFDPSEVEIHVFSTGPPDHPEFIRDTMRGADWRQRVMDAVDVFHDVRRYKGDHVGLARYIHQKEIQILIEWDGYARQGDRAEGLMALRPAPVQILHQEFLMTSGAQYVDYIVTDEVVSPMRLEGLYTEKFLYLPDHFFSKGHAVQEEVMPPRLEYLPREGGADFRPGVGSPRENACLSSNPLGTTESDDSSEREVSFVYCNFNKFLKNNPETMRSWIRVLEEVPNSILCLLENPSEGVANLRKFVGEEVAAAKAKANTAEVDNNYSDSDVDARIHFIPWEMNPFDHQQRSHSLCNVMLDSHPYNGHTTAQDALYAGVPVVTRSDGDDMSSRVSTSANVVLGLEELNAYKGVEEYEDIAIRLGTDEVWFASIRERLIETCLRMDPMHPYWDVPRYVENFQTGLKIIWDGFIRGEKMDHVHVLEIDHDVADVRRTTQIELAAKENKRKEHVKRKRLMSDGEL